MSPSSAVAVGLVGSVPGARSGGDVASLVHCDPPPRPAWLVPIVVTLQPLRSLDRVRPRSDPERDPGRRGRPDWQLPCLDFRPARFVGGSSARHGPGRVRARSAGRTVASDPTGPAPSLEPCARRRSAAQGLAVATRRSAVHSSVFEDVLLVVPLRRRDDHVDRLVHRRELPADGRLAGRALLGYLFVHSRGTSLYVADAPGRPRSAARLGDAVRRVGDAAGRGGIAVVRTWARWHRSAWQRSSPPCRHR